MLGYSVQVVESVCACMLIANKGVCHGVAHFITAFSIFDGKLLSLCQVKFVWIRVAKC